MNGFSQLLRDRIFRLFWAGEVVSVLGDQFYLVALPLLTFDLTGSPAQLGAVLMTAAIPRAVLMPIGGVMVDRWSPQAILLMSNFVRGLVVAVLTTLLVLGGVEAWHLYVLAGLFGAVDALSFPAFMSFTPRLVEQSKLEAANAVIQGTAQLAGMLGPALAGVLIAMVGMVGAFAIDTASFAISVVTLWAVVRMLPRTPSSPMPQAMDGDTSPPESPPEELGFGGAIRYILKDPVLRTVLVIVVSINVGVLGPVGVGLPALVLTQLHGDSTMLGAVMGTFGAGSLMGTLVAAFAPRPQRAGRVTSYATGTLAAAMALLGLAIKVPGGVPAIFVMLLVAGVALGYLNVVGLSWLQARVPPLMMGRVMAFMVLAANGLTPFSFAISGLIAEAGVVPLFVGGGAAVGGAWLAARGRAFRNSTWAIVPGTSPIDVINRGALR